MTDWRLYARGVAIALVGKIFLWIRQNSANGTAIIEEKTIHAIDRATSDK